VLLRALVDDLRHWHHVRHRVRCLAVVELNELAGHCMKKSGRDVTRSRIVGRSEKSVDFPPPESIGYQIRATHRLLQRVLQLKLEPFGVTLGMWYFLRALWSEDGLTQRELSRRVGTMEPTTLAAILSMEQSGLVKRVRSKSDRRKQHVHLTAKGRDLQTKLIPLARAVVAAAVDGFETREVRQLLEALTEIQKNLLASISQFDEIK
jgi:MarR family transcriptional regulator, organic hydroperoxide resistance regulator